MKRVQTDALSDERLSKKRRREILRFKRKLIQIQNDETAIAKSIEIKKPKLENKQQTNDMTDADTYKPPKRNISSNDMQIDSNIENTVYNCPIHGEKEICDIYECNGKPNTNISTNSYIS